MKAKKPFLRLLILVSVILVRAYFATSNLSNKANEEYVVFNGKDKDVEKALRELLGREL